MSDSDRSAESEPTSSPDSNDSAEPSDDASSSASLPAAEAARESESNLEAEANPRAQDAPNSGARKRSSIRPARPDWRPSARAVSNPPRPMVVVYSGESERPDRWWHESGQPSYPPALDADTPLPPEPALSARELRPPPAARFPEIVPPAPEQSVTGTAKFPSVALTSAANTLDPGATEAPVALSSLESSGSLLRVAESRPRAPARSEQVADSDARRVGSLRRASGRRAAIVIAGAFLGAYIAAQRFAARAPAPIVEKVSANVAASVSADTAPAAQPEPAAPAPPEPAPAQPESAPVSAISAPSEAAPADSIEAAAAAPSGARTVVIEVVPYDAKVLLAGVAQPGPPFVVSVPEGKRVAFEVARKGYAPRRVVVDGSESKLTVGLLHNRGLRIEPAPAAPRPPEPEPGEPGKDSRLRVRSGL